LLTVLELLQARRMTGAELARRLEVDRRTVRRYVETLQGMGIPVEGERGRYGAYSLKRGHKMPPLMFTDEEALGLALSLLAARGLGLSGVAPAVEGALAKLERVMPEALRGRVRSLEEAVSLSVAGPRTPTRGETLMTLAGAAGERRRVRMRYRSGRSEETEREVDPYGVLRREGYWYAAGHCHLRGGLRLFRVDRVLEAEVLGETFALPEGLGSPEAVLRALEDAPREAWRVEVLLEAGAEEARAQLPPMGISLEEVEGGTLLRCPTRDLGWVARVLAGLDCPFVVRRPDELREALERRAREICAMAKRAETGAPS
jgi:predicted DNA-binding transcriptional regulator YafY